MTALNTGSIGVDAPTSPASKRSPGSRTLRRLAGLAVAALPFALAGCQVPTFGGYRGATSQAHDEFKLWAGTFIAAIVVGGIVALLILWAVIRYRRRSDDMPRQTQYHVPLEIFYSVVPIIIVLVLFGFTFAGENKVDNISGSPAVRVHVTAFQWGWKFDYVNYHEYVQGVQRQNPDPVGANGNLHSCTATAAHPEDCLGPGLVIPEGQTTQINLVSNDVVHDFYVPAFNFDRYAQPGVTTQLFNLTPTRSGVFRAQCDEICGLYHSQMYFHVVVLPPVKFAAWLHSGQAIPDSSSGAADSTGIQANSNLQPAYPAGSGAGSVQYPTPTAGQHS